ncbi:MAG: hypothetical protein JW797_14465 [Bradymonadales bacterium]|nr:hypothetical protein [Bradymonadales bacterium]
MLAVIAGCDTVAEISFTQRQFYSASTMGLIHDGECTQTDTITRFRFAMLDGDGVLLQPGDQVGDRRIVLTGEDASFYSNNVEFFQSYLYPSPDQPCANNDQCTAPFECLSVNPFSSDARKACGRAISIETLQGNVNFLTGDQTRSIAFLMDYSNTLLGVNEQGGFDRSLSSDPNDKRISAATAFILRYERSPFGQGSKMCVVSFGGESRGGVEFQPRPESCLTDDFEEVRFYVSRLAGGEEGSASPIWSAILETIDQQLANAPGDRIIVLFTDGLDDGSLTDTYDAALNALVDYGVTIHIIQLDNPPPPEPGGDRPYIGPDPLDQFARMACETGGSFQYARSPDDLRILFENLALNIGASYEIRSQVGVLGTTEQPAGQYRIATGVRFTLHGTSVTLNLVGQKTDPVTSDLVDDRLVVLKRPLPPMQ